MESWGRPGPEQVGNLGACIRFEVVAMTKLMVGSKEPARIRFDALESTNVIFKIDVPARSMSVLFPLIAYRNRKEIRFLPKTIRQRRKTQPGVESFCCLNDPRRLTTFEILVDVSRFH